MTERPIIFSGPMVRAILDGRKTQTRRVVNPQPVGGDSIIKSSSNDGAWWIGRMRDSENAWRVLKSPYGVPGDRLWVRETGWERPERTPKMMREGADTWRRYYYDADGLPNSDHEQFKDWGFKRRPSIFMPRWASRITLEITGVRVERLQEIHHNLNDLEAEGIELPPDTLYPHTNRSDKLERVYHNLWESLNAKRAPWASNPWVWVVEFRR